MGLYTRAWAVRGLFRGLHESDVDADPFKQFEAWFGFAKRAGVYMPEAMALATATAQGVPSVRMMLLKGWRGGRFTFFTNYDGRKGHELAANPHASVVLHWTDLYRQVRAEGAIVKATPEESNAYFQSRPRGSRIGAWASAQSTVLSDRGDLARKVETLEKEYAGKEIPCPPFWGGFHLVPRQIEFWQGRAYRLHDRLVYVRDGQGWKLQRLSP
jgi:pyridoxamine 5'-phosphate oxidase